MSMARDDALGWICAAPFADQAQARRAPAQIGLGLVRLVGGQAGEVGHVELGKQILAR